MPNLAVGATSGINATLWARMRPRRTPKQRPVEQKAPFKSVSGILMQREDTTLALLTGGGEFSGLIRALDWSHTSVGPLARWPTHMKAATALMLRSVVPMVMLWNPDGVMVSKTASRSVVGGTAELRFRREPQNSVSLSPRSTADLLP